ncbi:uncharacterized protein Dwil_GK25139 [Drosophila willistoni]|uniref:Gustatory receptor n=1 Tax=Drosophila willistoni TaxID=7260 RepID=B4NC60_DROWI|nr:uncharacterized protein Dwil_GK25139 [Drosophila willistoni]
MAGQLGRVLHYHLRFYQLLGFHGLPLPGDAHPLRTQRCLQIWSFCLMIFLGTLAVFCVCSEDEFIHIGDTFGSFNDVLKYTVGGIAVVSIYVETLISHRHLARFWRLHGLLSDLLPSSTSTSSSWWRELRQHWRYLSWFHGLTASELALLAFFSLGQGTIRRHLVLFWTTFQPFVWLTHIRNIQFVLHVELLRQQLKQLAHELNLLAEYSKFANRRASFEGFENYLRRQLRQKQLIYDKIYDMYTSFQAAFRYSMLTVLLMIGVRISVDCYFMYYTIYNNINDIDYLFILPALLEIPAFIYTSRGCMEMLPRIAYKLHSITPGPTSSSYPTLSLQVKQIQNFSLQMMHQPVVIHALGITILDGYLLTRLACSLSTYAIYAIQFMPKLRRNV